jgi:trk system potassium uptake protein TrkH
MNLQLVARMLSSVSTLIGITMLFSLPWAFPTWGYRVGLAPPDSIEWRGLWALLGSTGICFAVASALRIAGRRATGKLFRKEAMAVVGLSWVLATVLGALPFILASVERDTDIPMSIVDSLFESQSGFSTTGATVISDLEDYSALPHCILFWRSSTHFLGGLGIIVLFVVVLGRGSAGKALMRNEMPGPSPDSSTARVQHLAWQFTGTYVVFNLVLALLLRLQGLSWFDAYCHAFATMATGGFSTYNASLGHFQSEAIDYIVIVFMLLAGSNFTLLYLALIGRPLRLFQDIEFRAYVSTVAIATAIVMIYCFADFAPDADAVSDHSTWRLAIRHSLFQVVSIMTTTGFGTHDFDDWNNVGRVVMFVLMFVGGCAGSTGGGLKVIRHILFFKVLRLELEKAYHPKVVRPLRLSGKPTESPDLARGILVYFSLILVIFVVSWVAVVCLESDATWQDDTVHNKLIDAASGVAATLNNIGPGLGTLGATQNYGQFTWCNKLLFTFLMMVGRLEIFPILVLLLPGFWRRR